MKGNINRGDVKCAGMLRIHPVILVDLLCYTRDHRHHSALTEKNNTLDIADIIPILSKKGHVPCIKTSCHGHHLLFIMIDNTIQSQCGKGAAK